MAVRGRNVSAEMVLNYATGVTPFNYNSKSAGDTTAVTNNPPEISDYIAGGGTGYHQPLLTPLRETVQIDELGITITSAAGATINSAATIAFWFMKPTELFFRRIATCAIPGTAAKGDIFTTRDGTLTWYDGTSASAAEKALLLGKTPASSNLVDYNSASNRIFPVTQGLICTFHNATDVGTDGNTGSASDVLVAWVVARGYGAPPQ